MRPHLTLSLAMRSAPIVAGAILALGFGASLVTGDPFWAGASGIIATAGFVTVVAYGRTRVIGWSTAVPLFYLIMFGLMPLVEYAAGLDSLWGHGTMWRAQWVAVVGVASFGVVTAGQRKRLLRAHLRERAIFGGCFEILRSRPVVVACAAVGSLGALYGLNHGYFGLGVAAREVGSFAGLAVLAQTFLDVATVASWIHMLTTRSLRWRILAWSCVVLEMGISLFSRSKGAMLAPLVLMAVTYWYVRGRMPLKASLAVLVAYVSIAYPFVTGWRQTGSTEYRNGSEMVVEGAEYLLGGRWWTDARPEVSETTTSLSRGLFGVFSVIVDQTGRETPYLGGATYLSALEGLVPRALWASKPTTTIGHMVGVKYGFIGATDELTNIAPTAMGEMYINFGLFGVFFGMAAAGWIAAVMDRWLSRMGLWMSCWLAAPIFVSQEAVLSQGAVALLVKVGAVWSAATILMYARRTRAASPKYAGQEKGRDL